MSIQNMFHSPEWTRFSCLYNSNKTIIHRSINHQTRGCTWKIKISMCNESTTLPLGDTRLKNNKHHKPASHSFPSPHTRESCYMQHWRIPKNICNKKSYFCCLRYFRPPWRFCNLRCKSADPLHSSPLRIHFSRWSLGARHLGNTRGC